MQPPPRALWIVMILASSAKLTLIWSGWPETSLIADDAYYYFTIARHLAEGLGPTFDGLTPTNGFHPLWQAMLVPIFAIDDPWLPVRLAGTLSLGLDLASALLIWRWLEESPLRSASVWAASIWLLAPLSFLLGLRGLEASLHCTLVFAALRLASRLRPRPVLLGILIGLAGLARTDSPITVGIPVALLLFARRERPLAERLRTIAGTAGIAMLLVAPWLAWCQSQFGSIVQVSGRIQFLSDGLVSETPWHFESAARSVESVAHLGLAFVVKPLRWIAGLEFEPNAWWIPACVAWIVGAGFLAARGARQLWRAGARSTVCLIAGFLFAHQLLYGAILRSYSVWYALPAHGLLAILIGVAIADVHRWRSWAAGMTILFAAAYLTLAAAYPRALLHGARGPELHWRPRLEQIQEDAPWARVLGAWDAGAVGYVVASEFEDLHVVNLDGLVNNEVIAAVEEGRYADYLLETVDYLLQHPRRARLFLSITEVERFQAEFESARGLRYRPPRD